MRIDNNNIKQKFIKSKAGLQITTLGLSEYIFDSFGFKLFWNLYNFNNLYKFYVVLFQNYMFCQLCNWKAYFSEIKQKGILK